MTVLLCSPAIVSSLSRRVLSPSTPIRFIIFSQQRQSSIRRYSSKAFVPKELLYSSPGWTNTIHTRNLYLSQPATSRVQAMAAADVAPLIVVYVTVPNKETGSKLAHSIIENKLAACVNQIPGVESTYWWEGKVETDSEVLLIIKTRSALLHELTAHVNSNHPYDTPEVIALPITGGSDKYLKWVEDNTQKAQE